MLAKPNRLRARRDFKTVYSRGRSVVHPMLVLYHRPSRQKECRIGFSISKKLGGAVERNRIKRRLREAVRENLVKLRPKRDVVFVGRSRLKDADYEAICAVVRELLKRADLVVELSPSKD